MADPAAHDNGIFVEHDYALNPPKPTVDGEPRYERIPVGFYFSEHDRHVRFDDYDVRRAAYWALLAGACGHTYGHNSVWFTVDKSAIRHRRVREIWYDPRYGIASHFHTTDNTGFQTYTPPTTGRGSDWVLVLESEAAGFPLPGPL